MSVLNPYLNFRGEAREALDFYHSVFGGDLTVSSFSDLGMEELPESERDLVMHGQLETPAGFTLMAADTPGHMEYARGTNQFGISLSGPSDDDAQLRGYWQKLGEGGTIIEPLATAPWGASFGMLTDKFGVSWLVNIAAHAA
jgi:PhnB protein